MARNDTAKAGPNAPGILLDKPLLYRLRYSSARYGKGRGGYFHTHAYYSFQSYRHIVLEKFTKLYDIYNLSDY